MAVTKKFPSAADLYASLPQSDYVEGRALTAGGAERIAIPTGAKRVLYSATDHFCANAGSSSVAAAWPTDTTDGTASELNPTIRMIEDGQTHISVISNSQMVLTMSFYLAP